MKKYFLLFALVSLITGCSALRGSDPYRPNEPLSVTAKVAAKASTDDFDKSVGGTLRMQRDHVVQLSLTKFGIEGARLVFTPDSMIVLDRINKRFVKASYNDLQRYLPDEKPLQFKDVQAFFWNDHHRTQEDVEACLGALIPLELHVRRTNTVNVRGYKIARLTQLLFHVMDRDVRVSLELSKVRIRYDWNANIRVPAGYRPMDADLLRKLIKLFK